MASSWFLNGRPALFKALAAVCDQIDTDLAAELETRDQVRDASVLQELERAKADAAEVPRLESENRTLREQVASLKAALEEAKKESLVSNQGARDAWNIATPIAESAERVPVAATKKVHRIDFAAPHVQQPLGDGVEGKSRDEQNPEPHKLPGGTDIDIERTLAKLNAKCANLREALDKALTVARVRKEEVERWATYADKLKTKIQKLKENARQTPGVSHQPPSVAGPVSSHSLSGADATLLGVPASASPSTSFVSNPDPDTSLRSMAEGQGEASDTGPSGSVTSPRRALSVPLDLHDMGGSSTQGLTQGEETPADLPELPPLAAAGDDGVIIKPEPSSDGPVIISERPVKKRKQLGDGTEPTPSARRVKIEEEEESPPNPVVPAGSIYFDPLESMDLDEGQLHLRTPRKNRLAPLAPPPPPPPPPFRGDNGGSGGQSLRGLPQAEARRKEQNNGIAKQKPSMAKRQEPKRLLREVGAREQPAKPERTRQKLAPLEPDAPQLNRGIAFLAEDGEMSSDDSHTRDSPPPPGRLASLLKTMHAEQGSSTPRLSRQSKENLRPSGISTTGRPLLKAIGAENAVPSKPTLTPQSTGRQRRTGLLQAVGESRTGGESTPTPRDHRTAREPEAAKKSWALRKRPASELRLEDFKINPAYNAGSDFAFSEVVRGRTERDHLAGCVDPNCCGKAFRAMAASERDAAVGSGTGTGSGASSSSSSSPSSAFLARPENVQLLEEHLGDEAYVLGRMSREEKEDLWLEARTRQLADRFGKHRHRYHRRPSPPGFWNADFPSTQEEERDRREGEQMERALVQERHREAMKGGRWLFRDE